MNHLSLLTVPVVRKKGREILVNKQSNTYTSLNWVWAWAWT
jgi:hypothetical protein